MSRIKGVGRENEDDTLTKLSLGAMGAYGLLRGVAHCDVRALARGVQNFVDMAELQTPQSEKWFEIV